MTKYIKIITIIVLTASSFCSADIFKHRLSGEVFYGYATQKSMAEKTRIYVQEGEKHIGKNLDLSEYEIRYDTRGRKNNVVVIPLNHEAIIRSDTISKLVAKTISEASNKGPLYIILEIDLPGGRGDYMKVITSAIDKTHNCPVIAFITDSRYGGAYSAAAGIALACDKIFITPNSIMGTVAPFTEKATLDMTADQWQNLYSPPANASYGAYLSILAKNRNRPGVMAAALVDTGIEVIEVITDQHGTRKIIERAEKAPGDSVARTWSKTITSFTAPGKYSSSQTVKVSDSQTAVPKQPSILVLSADDAIYAKMADSIVDSRAEVIEALEADDARIIATGRIRKEVMNFEKNRGFMNSLLANIQELERQALQVEKQFEKISEASLNNMSTYEDERIKRLQRQHYQNSLRRNSRRNNSRNNRNYVSPEEVEAIERDLQETFVNPYQQQQDQLIEEYAYLLQQLETEYTRVSVVARRYPGTLPPDKTLQSINKRLNEIRLRLNSF